LVAAIYVQGIASFDRPRQLQRRRPVSGVEPQRMPSAQLARPSAKGLGQTTRHYSHRSGGVHLRRRALCRSSAYGAQGVGAGAVLFGQVSNDLAGDCNFNGVTPDN